MAGGGGERGFGEWRGGEEVGELMGMWLVRRSLQGEHREKCKMEDLGNGRTTIECSIQSEGVASDPKREPLLLDMRFSKILAHQRQLLINQAEFEVLLSPSILELVGLFSMPEFQLPSCKSMSMSSELRSLTHHFECHNIQTTNMLGTS